MGKGPTASAILLLFVVLIIGIGLLAEADIITGQDRWAYDNATNTVVLNDTSNHVCIGDTCSLSYQLSITNNASIAGSPICTKDNGLCPSGNGTAGGNPFNQSLNTTDNATFYKITVTGDANYAAVVRSPDVIVQDYQLEYGGTNNFGFENGQVYVQGVGDSVSASSIYFAPAYYYNDSADTGLIDLGFDGELFMSGGNVNANLGLSSYSGLWGQGVYLGSGDAGSSSDGKYANGAYIQLGGGQYDGVDWLPGSVKILAGDSSEGTFGDIALYGGQILFNDLPIVVTGKNTAGDINISGTIYYGALQANSPILETTHDPFVTRCTTANDGAFVVQYIAGDGKGKYTNTIEAVNASNPSWYHQACYVKKSKFDLLNSLIASKTMKPVITTTKTINPKTGIATYTNKTTYIPYTIDDITYNNITKTSTYDPKPIYKNETKTSTKPPK